MSQLKITIYHSHTKVLKEKDVLLEEHENPIGIGQILKCIISGTACFVVQ